MRHILPILLLCAVAARADTTQPLPTPFPEARYQQMSAKSPFAVASASAVNAAPTPGFAAQLYISGVALVGNTEYVAIKSRDQDDQHPALFLQVGQSSPDGMKVERLQWSDELGKSTVDVTKGGEKATLIFDEAQMAKTSPPAIGPGGIRMPNMPGQRPLNFPMQSAGPFNRSRILQQQQQQTQPGTNLGAPNTPNGIDTRRRVRLIQSGQ